MPSRRSQSIRLCTHYDASYLRARCDAFHKQSPFLPARNCRWRGTLRYQLLGAVQRTILRHRGARRRIAVLIGPTTLGLAISLPHSVKTNEFEQKQQPTSSKEQYILDNPRTYRRLSNYHQLKCYSVPLHAGFFFARVGARLKPASYSVIVRLQISTLPIYGASIP